MKNSSLHFIGYLVLKFHKMFYDISPHTYSFSNWQLSRCFTLTRVDCGHKNTFYFEMA